MKKEQQKPNYRIVCYDTDAHSYWYCGEVVPLAIKAFQLLNNSELKKYVIIERVKKNTPHEKPYVEVIPPENYNSKLFDPEEISPIYIKTNVNSERFISDILSRGASMKFR